MLRQDARNVATQVRTHRTQGTQKICRLRQDATPTDQTQDPFLLMNLQGFEADFVTKVRELAEEDLGCMQGRKCWNP